MGACENRCPGLRFPLVQQWALRMKPLLQSLFVQLRSLAHGLAGRVWFRLGNPGRATHHFERVLTMRGDNFSAYVYLGRLAYCSGDYPAWRREYAHAKRVCPERFDRLRHPFDPIEPRVADALLGEAGARATWRAVRPLPSAGRVLTSTRARDDFTSEVERQRFRPLGPISTAEIVALDLDHLLRRLAESG